ncbi:hypothetical protein P4233_30925 [Pseudomonas aeruginosa]|nr:hypothetical protein [Pseudomonas aeruginosa]
MPLTAADLGLKGMVAKVAGKAPDAAGNVPLTAADLGLKGMVAKVAGKAPDATGNVPDRCRPGPGRSGQESSRQSAGCCRQRASDRR